MTVTAAANTLILNSVIATTIDDIDVISIYDTAEYYRKAYTDVTVVSSTERQYTFYLTENEANTSITKMSLYGNGATVTLGTGTQMAYQNVEIEKTNTQSLLVYWNVRVI